MAATPACFSPRIFKLWEQANTSIPKGTRCESHCRDCMPSYQLRMKRAGRCEHPEVMFAFEEDGIVGLA